MTDIAIQVENLSKRYRIGLKEEVHDTLAGAMSDWVKRPMHNLRRLRQLTRFSENGHDPDDIIWALKDVSFEVKQGEVVGVIGRNGAGKSTLLKILSRITHPTSGRVVLNGRVSSLLEVGTGFHPELTGRENIYLNGTILGMRKVEIDRKFDEIVDFSGVEKFIDTPVKRYSSGMRVRLAFSVAAHLEPEILLVDEVLAVGDVSFQYKSLGKMEGVARSGRTILFVSHNIGMIRTLCPRSILLESGCIEVNAETSATLNRYLTVGVGEESSQISWADLEKAPGQEEIKLRCVRLLGSTDIPRSTFDASEPIHVEVIYEVLQKVYGMRMVLTLITPEGDVVFTSTDDYARDTEMIPGKYRTICALPPNLLNQKRYSIKLRSDIPNVKWLLPDKTYLSFKVTGGEKPGVHNPEKWPGIIAPSLEWQTEKIG